MSSEERFWPSRLKWRLRGASMWPAFVVVTLADGVLLHLLPPVRTGVELIPGILLATFANLILVAVAAPWLARRIRSRHTEQQSEAPPQAALEALTDRIGTGLLMAGVAAVLAAGLAARPVVVLETEEREENARLVQELVERRGDRELIRNLDAADTIRLRDGYYRNCIPRDDRERFFCFFVDVTKEPPEVVRDPSAEPNSTLRAP